MLVLTDMFGGTPANLALTFLDEQVEVVTGVNLPMLLKLSTCRTPDARLRRGGPPHLRVRAEEHHAGQRAAAPPRARRRRAERGAPAVIALVRVDNRLLHGQVLEAWMPHLGARRVVVADDEAARSPLARAAMTLALPPGVEARVEPVAAVDWAALARHRRSRCWWCSATSPRPIEALAAGLTPERAPVLNLGNVHFAQGRRPVTPSVFLSGAELEGLRRLAAAGFRVEARAVPLDAADRPGRDRAALERRRPIG